MDPNYMMTPLQAAIASNAFSNGVFLPGIFTNAQDQDEYLASLDSDTRAYVLEHTDEFRTKADIIDCIDRLHSVN